MRKHYVDNIRWMTVLLVVLYHVIYMYNGVITAGVIGPFHEVHYQDALQYLLYPWFMVILFIVSGMSSRFYLEKHTIKEFVAARTRKLLVPSTIGLFVFHWILGYFNLAIGNAFDAFPAALPKGILYLLMAVSGTGVLWYIQMLWIFSMGIALLRRFETGKFYEFCKKVNVSRQTLSKWETGDSLPDIEKCKLLADIFGVSLDDFVNYESTVYGLGVPPKGKHVFGLVTVGDKGQIVIPAKARKVFNINAGDQLLVLGDEAQGIAIIKEQDIFPLV